MFTTQVLLTNHFPSPPSPTWVPTVRSLTVGWRAGVDRELRRRHRSTRKGFRRTLRAGRELSRLRIIRRRLRARLCAGRKGGLAKSIYVPLPGEVLELSSQRPSRLDPTSNPQIGDVDLSVLDSPPPFAGLWLSIQGTHSGHEILEALVKDAEVRPPRFAL